MKTTIIKCTWSWMWATKSDDAYVKLPKTVAIIPTYLNVNEIKTIYPIEQGGKVIGSAIFYMGGVNTIKDDRTPDELMELINNL